MPFSFNSVELCVLTINEKPWTRAREACRALEYDAKTSKTVNIIRAHCSPENITQKYQITSVHAACAPINWTKDSQKYDVCINEQGTYELVFGSQQPKVRVFRKYCCNMLFLHVRQQLTNKIHEEHQQAVTDRDNQMQAHQKKILRLNKEIDDLIKNRHVAHRGYFDNVLCFIKKNIKEAHPYYAIR